VISLKKEEKNEEIEHEEQEKRYLLDLMKRQNEALKRIYKNTIDNEKKQ
jgi:predicted transposase